MFGLSICIKYSSEDSNQGTKSRNKSTWTGKEQAKLYLQITGSRLQKIQRNLHKILALIMVQQSYRIKHHHLKFIVFLFTTNKTCITYILKMVKLH